MSNVKGIDITPEKEELAKKLEASRKDNENKDKNPHVAPKVPADENWNESPNKGM
ncbi:MAG: hypothetical protein HY764_01920 [Candidatus Portnoybacteria bacterium]|nr:hypothetical protein [Candidatus Portnoybacteria bacterium]